MEEKTFLEHLEDLRVVFLKAFIVIIVLSGLSFAFAPALLKLILWPFHAAVARYDLEAPTTALLRTLRPSGAFMMSMKMALGAGFFFSLPLVLWFGGKFLLPGLTPVEKKYLLPALGAGTALFVLGAAFCYFFVLPAALGFFWKYGQNLGVANEWTIENYVPLVIQMLLAFGAVFELPVVLLFLVKIGLLNYAVLSKSRKIVLVGIFILAAVITPTPDILNQILLAVPMILLYEICVWIALWMAKSEKKRKHAE